MRTLTRARSAGGSLVVTIPREIVIEESLKEGELIEIEVRRTKKSFFGIARGIGPFKIED